MSEQLTLPAEQRERAGKGASRELRRSGRVPAVIYGDKKEPLSVHVEEKLLAKMLSTGHFMNTVVMIDAGGKAHRTLPKDVQFHPVSSRPIHVDFLRIGEHSQVNVNVPVNFTDEEAVARHQARRRPQRRPPRPRAGLRRGRNPRADQHLAQGPRHRRFDPHFEHRPAQGLEVGDRRPRLHHRDRRCSVGDEVRGRRHRHRDRRPKCRPSVTKKPKAKAANEA